MKFEELIARKLPTAEEIDTFLESNSVPLVRPGRVIFIYRGQADKVHLRQWIYGMPADPPLIRLGQTDLWYLDSELPDGSRIEYKFEVITGNLNEWITDPLNPEIAQDPFGSNSVCHGYGYTPPDWTLPSPEARRGSLDQLDIQSAALGETRQVAVYLPARFRRRRRYSVLVVHDGGDFLHFAGLTTVLDNLIHKMEIAPLIVAFVNPGERTKEYAADDRHARFLTEELHPQLDKSFSLDDHPESRGLMGASLGAVASLHAAWSKPGFYDRLMLMSGSFAFSDIGGHHRGPTFDPVVEFVNRFRKAPGRSAKRIYMSCGIYESLIYENRSILPLLREGGALVRYDEARDGHNWENWRDRQQNALSWLFPGPLWMNYE